MTLLPGIRRLFRLGGVHDVERAVDDELCFHFEQSVRELVAAGMRDDEARREAERRFGDVGAARERLAALDRERLGAERREEWWSALGQDLRYALRGLRLKPGFTAGVVLTLGLGIGANATMFGVVDRLLLRPPAYLAHAGRVHRVYFARRIDGVERATGSTSYARFLDMRRLTRRFDVVAAAFGNDLAIGTGEASAELRVHGVSAGFWRLFDMRPALGRFFAADEDSAPETAHVVVLGYGFWRSRFGGSVGVLGQRLRIGRNEYTIIGVAPSGFQGAELDVPVAIIPMTAMVAGEMADARHLLTYRTTYSWSYMNVYVRRRAGVSLAQATDELSAAYRRSYEQQRVEQPQVSPPAIAQPHAIAAPVQRARGPNRGSDAQVAIWLVGVAAIVLVIACANVGNLLLARAFGRRREIAVRLALGISRGRLVAQLLIESAVLALLGGVAGVVLARWGGGVLRATLLPDVVWNSTLTDARTLAVCAAVALLTGVVTGLAPALYALRSDVASALKAGVREGTYHRSPTRSAMLVVQGALSVVLLVGAGLFVRSFRHAQSVALGYDPDRVLYVSAELRGVSLSAVELGALKRRLLERARSLPGVEHAARVVTVPFWMEWDEDLYVAGIDSVSKFGRFELQAVSPEYFVTMGTRLLRGRGIGTEDVRHMPRVMVVSRAMARTLWPGREALGQCVRIGADTMPCTTVVGVAEDIKTTSLSDDKGLMYYLSIEQLGEHQGGLFVRTRGAAAPAAGGVRRALQSLMPGAAYVTTKPLADILAPERRSWALGATMFTLFGALALLVASVGLYSVVSYGVAQRSHELGVRIALGARVGDILRMVVGEGMRTVLAATALGLGAAWFAARWVGPLLFETSPRDPIVFGGVAALLVGIALVASVIPAVRASRVDPVTALRAD